MRKGTLIRSCFIVILAIIVISSVVSISCRAEGRAGVGNDVLDTLRNDSAADVIVILQDDGRTGLSAGAKIDVLTVLRNGKERLSTILQDVLATLNESDFTLNGIAPFKNFFHGILTQDGLQKLIADPHISHIELNHKGYFALDQSVPLVGTPSVWKSVVSGVGIKGDGQTVCIIDTGVNYTHPDLGGCNVTSNISDGSCKKVIGGHNYCPSAACSGNGDDNVIDIGGHGTNVAGVVTANGSVKGVAPESRIVALKIAYNMTPDEAATAKAIQWCLDHSDTYNITIITMSMHLAFGTENCYPDSQVSVAISNATQHGIYVVASSGNEGRSDQLSFPGCAANTTSTGSTYDYTYNTVGEYWSPAVGWICNDSMKTKDLVACYTNRNGALDLLAPGSVISTTSGNGLYEDVDGTSFAAPHVAGAAALLIQYEKLKYNKTLTSAEIEQRFKDTGVLINDTGIYSTNGGTNLTFPRIDVYAALFPIDVHNLTRVYTSTTRNVFRFMVKNNYNNKTKSINWSFAIGNGTVFTNQLGMSVKPKKEAIVLIEHNYTDGDIYTINATACSGGGASADCDEETLVVPVGQIIAYDLREVASQGKQKTFRFRARNNMNETRAVGWYLNINGSEHNSYDPANVKSGKEMIVIVQYNFTNSGNYAVWGAASNGSISDLTKTISVNIL